MVDAPEPPVMPAGLRRLWGIDEGRRPGQRPSLDVHQVARAGIALADEGGLEAVSMSRVAASLGVTTMALYRYVESKAELLELMLEVGAGEPPPIAADLGWREAVAAWAANLAARYARHPWVLQVQVTAPPRGPYQLAWAEQGMAALAGTGLAAEERLDLVTVLLVFVRGLTSLERQLGQLAADREFEASFEAVVGQLDAERYPNLAGLLTEPSAAPSGVAAAGAAAKEGAVTRGAAGPGGAATEAGTTTFGLERILDGIEALVRDRSA